ncbi:MAG: DUF1015 family protein, partial [Gemmatimonadales bacterium]
RHAAGLLRRWRANGVVQPDSGRSVYVVRQAYDVDGRLHRRTGVICAVSVEPYEERRVLPHERTHAHVKEDRLQLMRATGAMCESLFFLAPDREAELERRLSGVTTRPPDMSARLDEVHTEVWVVQGPVAATIAETAGRDRLYIADGHHRYETGWLYRKENAGADRTLALVVPAGDPGLVVLPTHRIIDRRVAIDDIRALLSSSFELSECDTAKLESALAAEVKTACGIILAEGTGMLARLKPEAELCDFARDRPESVRNLAIARIDELVVKPLVRTSGGSCGYSAYLKEVVQNVSEGGTGIVVKPISVDDVMRVADDGAFMPQKATYFIPKVPSGLVFLNFDRLMGAN